MVEGLLPAEPQYVLLNRLEHIIPPLGHCISTWYAVSRYLEKLMELETKYGRGDSDLIVIIYM